MPKWILVLAIFLNAVVPTVAGEPDVAAIERGRKALTETAFIKAFWTRPAYDSAWKVWNLPAKPTDYSAAIQERYGLHPAPYPNGDLPMGLRKANLLIGTGIGLDCMLCHGGSMLGKSYVGLGNSSLDVQAVFEEFAAAGGMSMKLPFTFAQSRGINEAGAFSVYLLGFRNPDLSLANRFQNLGLRDDSSEDVPAWWLMKKKRTMYYTGNTDARSVRSIMQFMMHPLTVPEEFHAAEPAFRDILQYLLSMEPPKYPYPVDVQKVKAGEAVFRDQCAKCHGTYGERWTYPNKVIPLAEIGTDPKRYENIGLKFGETYNASWFAQEGTKGKPVKQTVGYQAPPLDGIWATAPYFHNSSVPTLDGVLNSRVRPKVFTRSFRTGAEDYDPIRVGWKVREVTAPAETLPGIERRKVYDTTRPGRKNTGHTYGDDLSDAERVAVIEYLKTL